MRAEKSRVAEGNERIEKEVREWELLLTRGVTSLAYLLLRPRLECLRAGFHPSSAQSVSRRSKRTRASREQTRGTALPRMATQERAGTYRQLVTFSSCRVS